MWLDIYILDLYSQDTAILLHGVFGIRAEVHYNLMHLAWVDHHFAIAGDVQLQLNGTGEGRFDKFQRFIYDQPNLNRLRMDVLRRLAAESQNLFN